VFRASKHPSAATQAAHASSTITWDGDLGEVEPLPKFAPDALGDCIDCTICVQVCPVGIDIRNGLQYECIACGACIDACDEVMEKVGYPKGLIRYSTQNSIDGKNTRVLRPRILVYGAILLALMVGWGFGVSHRDPLIAEVLRDRNALFRETAADIENGPWPLPGETFAAVVVTNYLWRALLPQIVASVAPGGVLIYETFSREHARIGKPSRPDFLLQPGELLAAASGLRIVAYEDGFCSDPDRFVQRLAAVREAPADGADPPRHRLDGAG